jgi:pyruvate-formate lyase-activating enzyme
MEIERLKQEIGKLSKSEKLDLLKHLQKQFNQENEIKNREQLEEAAELMKEEYANNEALTELSNMP